MPRHACAGWGRLYTWDGWEEEEGGRTFRLWNPCPGQAGLPSPSRALPPCLPACPSPSVPYLAFFPSLVPFLRHVRSMHALSYAALTMFFFLMPTLE